MVQATCLFYRSVKHPTEQPPATFLKPEHQGHLQDCLLLKPSLYFHQSQLQAISRDTLTSSTERKKSKAIFHLPEGDPLSGGDLLPPASVKEECSRTWPRRTFNQFKGRLSKKTQQIIFTSTGSATSLLLALG